MIHPHLLPHEIDLLVDGAAGAGVAALRAHLGECDACRERFEALHVVGNALDGLPHFSPHSRLANSVMAKVQVIEPWPVALIESARRLIPSSAPLRVLIGLGAGIVAATISGGVLWLALRVDLATWALDLFLDRGRQQLAAGASEAAAVAFGPGAPTTWNAAGGIRLLFLFSVLALSCIGAAVALRRLAETARSHRG